MTATALIVAHPRSDVDHIKNAIGTRADEFKAALPSHIGVDKFQRTVATAVMLNPKLLECDRQSLLLSCIKLATDGLLPDGREAALVPFKTRVRDGSQWSDKWLVQPMPMSYGLRKKVLQSGEVVSLQVGVAYRAEVESGYFLYEIGIEPPIRHRPNLFLTEEEATDDNLAVAYSIARIKNDAGGEPFWSVEIMPRREILKVRQMSQTGAVGKTGRDGKPIPPKGPWVDWESEMWKKSVLRRHCKVLPMSSDILATVLRDDEETIAQGASAMLGAVDGSEPIRLPSNDDLDAQASGETVDADTGEVVTTDAHGMTQTDEETARALDTQAGQQGSEQNGADEPAYAQAVRDLKARLLAATTPAQVEAERKFVGEHITFLPEPVQRDIRQALAAAHDRASA